MAQVIAPEVWQDGIDDNQLLPNRYTVGLFTGRGINLANDGRACRVYDILVSDYITDYDDRRLNGLGYGGEGFNADGRDGWGASSYGVFQDVKFTSKVYTMGRHRSTAMRLFDEMQYDGGENDAIGAWGTGTTSYVSSNGQSLLKTAALMSKAKDRWEKQVLGPDIDKYVLFAICSGHQTGRLVGTTAAYNDKVFDGDASHYQWVAQPGTVQGQAIPPSFAPIHCIEWDEEHVAQMLQNVKVTWNNLFIEQSDRVVLIDPFYEYALLSALTGGGVPATESAYTDMQNGSFTKLMGWDFNFEIPSNYWPKLYLDANLNVVHSSAGTAAYDKIINSINGGTGNDALLKELIASDRMSRTNWIRTDWDASNGFTKTLSNYPMGSPGWDGFYGADRITVSSPNWGSASDVYPWEGQGSGYGLHPYDGIHATSDYATGPQGSITLTQVIGMFLYKKAAQMSQEYSEMVTDEGVTRGKFQEMCMDVKYDAWVIENLSHGIIPIVNSNVVDPVFSIPVSIVSDRTLPMLTGVTITKSSTTLTATESYNMTPASPATLAYQWYKNGTAIASGGTSSTLSIASGFTTDDVVECVVTATGTASGTAKGSYTIA